MFEKIETLFQGKRVEAGVDGKVALVTGATQGIGRAIAETLAQSGAGGLLLTGRDQARGDLVAKQISDTGVPAVFIGGELSDPDVPGRLVGACVERFGRIDLLANAAGLTDRASLLDGTLDEWAKLFDVNARAPFFLMQGAVKAMLAQGGSIVNIQSINAHCGAPELAIYSATKAALAVLTRNVANAHRFDRIKVNGINVGWADTPAERVMQAETLGNGPGWIEAANATLPFGRMLAAQEVANLAVFLLSDASGPMTGTSIDQEQVVIGANR
jgi:NAD(P)-dependent dehydrogenase (short-subunit alcohol dehydrogenase family)